MSTEPSSNALEYSVSEVSHAVKRTVEDAFGYVRVRGEISGFRGQHGSGHAYFALKDEKAKLEAVIWKGVFNRLKIKPQEGLEVIATGKITTYPGSSKYQIVIDRLEPAGIGALMALLEERKNKLAREGLFDPANKKPLPYLPKTIGVITSPTGAVIKDILHRLDDRFPSHVLLWPVRVQGETCGEEVSRAIHGFNTFSGENGFIKPDLLIVARGGGSLEDLWGFNDEAVVRAVANSSIPIISAVGHETDWTLIDYAADKRAPTPTGAAEMAVPVKRDLLSFMDDLDRRHKSAALRLIDRHKNHVTNLSRALPKADTLLALPCQRLDALDGRLLQALNTYLAKSKAEFKQLSTRHSLDRLSLRLHSQRQTIQGFENRLVHGLERRHQQGKNRLTACSSRLSSRPILLKITNTNEKLQNFQATKYRAFCQLIKLHQAGLTKLSDNLRLLSYQGVLERGFVLIKDETGKPVRSSKKIGTGKEYKAQFFDGEALFLGQRKQTGVSKPKISKPEQGNLF